METGTVGGVVSDPPYGLEFMGKEWDRIDGTVLHDPSVVGGFQDGAGGNPYSRSRIRYGRKGHRWEDGGGMTSHMNAMQEWHRAWLVECYRVLVPGGVIKAFSATRTFHRMAAAMQEAGFTDIRLEAWSYGSGFPKSLSISKAIDKQAGAERAVVDTVKGMGKQNPEWNGTAQGRAENSFKPEYALTAPATDAARQWDGWGTALKPSWEPVLVGTKPA